MTSLHFYFFSVSSQLLSFFQRSVTLFTYKVTYSWGESGLPVVEMPPGLQMSTTPSGPNGRKYAKAD